MSLELRAGHFTESVRGGCFRQMKGVGRGYGGRVVWWDGML
jgi:hypothetical protein